MLIVFCLYLAGAVSISFRLCSQVITSVDFRYVFLSGYYTLHLGLDGIARELPSTEHCRVSLPNSLGYAPKRHPMETYYVLGVFVQL